MTDLGFLQQANTISFDERIEIILKELEIAIQWDRPAVILVVYNSEYVRADAEAAVKNLLIQQGQKVNRIELGHEDVSDIIPLLRKFQSAEDSIFFIHGCEPGQGHILAKIGHHKDIFIRKRIRLVIWLTSKALVDLACNAPDLWEQRQHVVEFPDAPNAEYILHDAVESAWQGTGEYADPYQDTEEKINLHESMLTGLPQQAESTSTRAKLLLTLGILNWRKGDFEKADEMLHDALKFAVRMEDSWFEAECFNAIALVKFAQNKNDEAIEAYKQAIQIAPEQIFVWNNLGNLCLKINRNDEAMLAFQKTLKHNPKDPIAWSGLGAVYYRIGYVDDCISAYRKAIEYAPLLPQPWSGLGDAYVSTGRDLDAVAAYQKAIELNKNFLTPWLRLADVYCRQGRNRDAIKTYQRALAVNPKNHHVWNELGLLFIKINSYEEAAAAFLKAIEIDRAFGWAYSNLALAYGHQEKYAEAIQACKQSLQAFTADSDKMTAWDRLAGFYRAVNDYENAMRAYQMADMLKSGSTPAAERGTNLPAADSAPQAESQPEVESTAALEENPAPLEDSPALVESSPARINPPAWLFQQEQSMSTAYSETFFWKDELFSVSPEQIENEKQKEEALPMTAPHVFTPISAHEAVSSLKLSEASVPVDPFENAEKTTECNDPEVWNEKGNIHFQNGEYESAITAYNKAIALNKSFGWSYHNLAHTYLKMGKYAEAALLYEKSASLLERKEEKAAAWNNLGNIYRHLNEYGNALQAYQKADELDTRSAERRDSLELTYAAPNSRSVQVWMELGNLFFKLNSYKKAVAAYTTAVQLDPDSGWAHSNLAMALAFEGRYQEAVSVYLKSINLFTEEKDKAVAWNRLGNVYRRMNDEENARKAYQTAMILSNKKIDLVTRARFSLLDNCLAN